ncbi:MAG: radical SAM protein [Candidatus Hydrogenedentota bacterium]
MKRYYLLAKRFYKRLFKIQAHQSAGPNATPLRLIWNALPYLFLKNGYSFSPLSLFFIINSRCNFKCKMCDVGQNNSKSMFYKNLVGSDKGDYPVEAFKRLIDEVKGFKPYISITSTEPLLYKPLPEIINYVIQSGLIINVLTNGYILEKRAEELVDAGLYSLNVSIDGPPTVHNQLRGVSDAFERAIAGIMKIVERKEKRKSKLPYLGINATITDSTAPYMVDLIKSLPMKHLAKVSFMTMVFLYQELADLHNREFGDRYFATEVCLSGGANPKKVDVDKLVEQSNLVKKMYPDKVFLYYQPDKEELTRYFYKPDEFMDNTRCVFPWFSAQILSNGDLVGLTRCYPTVFGNVVEKSFKEVWLGEKIREFRKDLQKYGRFPACTRCEGVLYE